MIDKKHIIKMAKAVVRRDKGYPDRRLMHPQREWFIGLAMFTFLVFLGSLFAAHTFVTYQNIDALDGDPGSSIPSYKEASVAKALTLYRLRAQEFTKLREEMKVSHSRDDREGDIDVYNSATSSDTVVSSTTEQTRVLEDVDEEQQQSENHTPPNLEDIELSF